LLGLEKTVVEAVEEEDGAVAISVRPVWSQRDRCPHCRRRCPGYDLGEGRRRWRALDLDTTLCFLEADAARVECREHGVVVAAVPWARHDAGFTRSFEDTAAWLAGQHIQDGDLPAVADRVADGGADLRARQRRGESGP
jgi:transposase